MDIRKVIETVNQGGWDVAIRIPGSIHPISFSVFSVRLSDERELHIALSDSDILLIPLSPLYSQRMNEANDSIAIYCEQKSKGWVRTKDGYVHEECRDRREILVFTKRD
ncbi:hypothetical protein HOI18_03780 [Candidatus Uhrbacteria bacterium]|nr:hypothetical protein [Candidatus Uhrbacteria bacterium]